MVAPLSVFRDSLHKYLSTGLQADGWKRSDFDGLGIVHTIPPSDVHKSILEDDTPPWTGNLKADIVPPNWKFLHTIAPTWDDPLSWRTYMHHNLFWFGAAAALYGSRSRRRGGVRRAWAGVAGGVQRARAGVAGGVAGCVIQAPGPSARGGDAGVVGVGAPPGWVATALETPLAVADGSVLCGLPGTGSGTAGSPRCGVVKRELTGAVAGVALFQPKCP
ncbi:hypothetical protein V5799_032164 [Amblyomma americanum]|uniref:Uncharacterized protein n=1 Tax=Amblyomma americanum TaxID=6943 RepID=A0AAQ4DRY6_AMBAM